jgi:thioredoxin-dependent peroxiredoxin
MLSRRNFFSAVFAVVFSFLSWSNFAPAASALGGKLPTLNAPAPSFSLPTNTGDGKVSLQDYQGKWVVLYFYPKDFTSGCTLEARRFQQDMGEYATRNAQIIGVSADSVDSHAKFCDWLGIFSMRHTFIISPDGELKASFTGVNPSVHSKEVLSKLDELKSA